MTESPAAATQRARMLSLSKATSLLGGLVRFVVVVLLLVVVIIPVIRGAPI